MEIDAFTPASPHALDAMINRERGVMQPYLPVMDDDAVLLGSIRLELLLALISPAPPYEYTSYRVARNCLAMRSSISSGLFSKSYCRVFGHLDDINT